MTAELADVAPAFVEMAHRIVWASVATVGPDERPRTRILHPIWEWDSAELVGWIATEPTPLQRAHLVAHPFVSVNYWAPNHDTCVAECAAELLLDLPTREATWARFAEGPAPVGYDPAMIPQWDSPASDAFAVVRLEPWRLRVFPGTVLLGQGGTVRTWRGGDVTH
jgi:hypothetical protein